VIRASGDRHLTALRDHVDVETATLPIVVEVDRGCTLEGKLTGDGWRVPGCTIEVLEGGRPPVAPDGRFTCEVLMPGKHHLMLIMQNSFTIEGSITDTEVLFDVKEFEVTEPVTAVEFDTSPWVPGELSGRVVCDEELPPSSQAMLISTDPKPLHFGSTLTMSADRSRSGQGFGIAIFGAFALDEANEFMATQIIPGTYAVVVMYPSGVQGFLQSADLITIGPGATVESSSLMRRTRMG